MNSIFDLQRSLTHHPVYDTFHSVENIRHFMRHHAFAVWDFMSLLKALQKEITCVSVPWVPSKYPTELVRFINQIVVGEESDLDPQGRAVSHYELYLQGMEEVGASTEEIRKFVSEIKLEYVTREVRDFVGHNLKVATSGHVVEIAASFFFGREKLIPDMFQSMVDTLKREQVVAPTFIYYLERHIEVDSNEHGPLAMKCLETLIGGDPELHQLAESAGVKALELRRQLWDRVLEGSRIVSHSADSLHQSYSMPHSK